MRNKFLICLICTALLYGCEYENNSKVEQTTNTTILEPKPVEIRREQLNISMRIPKTLNPLLNEDVTVNKIMHLLFDNLITINEYEKPTLNLLESYEIINGGKTIRCVLKPNKWHNNESITAKDIAFSIDVLKSAKDTAFYKTKVLNIASYKIDPSNELALDINYNKASVENLYSLDFPIIPAGVYTNNLETKDIIGSGAYKFLNSPNIKEINLVRNEGYSQENNSSIKYIKVYILSDFDSDVNSFLQGVTDVIDLDIIDWGKYGGIKQAHTTTFITNNYDFIGFNYKNPVFSETPLKKAIAHAIDKKQILKSIYLDYAVLSISPINPNSWLYEAGVSEYDYDLEQSKQLISSLGYVLNSEDLLSKQMDGINQVLKFKILVNSENNQGVSIANVLSDNLSKVGIQSEVESLPFEQYMEKVNKRDFDILLGGYNLSSVPDLTFMFGSDSPTNLFSYKNETMDAKLDSVVNSQSEVELKYAVSDLQLFIAEEIPCISLGFRKSVLLTDVAINGEIIPTNDNVFNSIRLWFFQ